MCGGPCSQHVTGNISHSNQLQIQYLPITFAEEALLLSMIKHKYGDSNFY